MHVFSLHKSVVHKLTLQEIGEKRKKDQFMVVLYLLKKGCLMTNYESFKDLFSIIKVKNMQRKHLFRLRHYRMHVWCDCVCMKEIVRKFPFIAIFTYEMKIVKNELWISIHGYVLENWWQIFILLNLKRVANDDYIRQLYIKTLLNIMLIQGGVT